MLQIQGSDQAPLQSIVVKMIVGGDQVTVDARPDDMLHLRRQLEERTGIPMQHQKLMLSSINQLVLGDKRLPIKYAHCGTANSLSMVFGNNQG